MMMLLLLLLLLMFMMMLMMTDPRSVRLTMYGSTRRTPCSPHCMLAPAITYCNMMMMMMLLLL